MAQPPRFLDRVFESSDSDGDGRISKDEAAESRFPRISLKFEELDKDSNGTLDRVEFGNFSFRSSNPVEAVVTALERINYSGKKVDDETSARLHELFIRNLDPMKLYFLQSDIDEFQSHATEHDDMLRKNAVSIAETIVKRYRERFDERLRWAQTFSDAEFDFEQPDVRPIVPEACEFAVDADHAKDRWRKEVKFRLVQLINSGMNVEQARKTAREAYRQLADNKNKMDDAFASNMYLKALANSLDPHSSFAPPDEAKENDISLSQSLVGVGITIQNNDGKIEVVSLTPGGPAEESGHLVPGDHIVAVGEGQNGAMVNVSGQAVKDVATLIRGESGSTVRLSVEREDGSLETALLVRREMELSGVEHKMVLSGPTESSSVRIGLIRIPAFYGSKKRTVSLDTRDAVKELVSQNANAIVIDLRNNGGGILDEAVAIAGLFIDGPVVQLRDSRGIVSVRSDEDDGVLFTGPLAILTNRNSASASEILSMAIQDYRRGVVIGDSQTFGKGSSAARIDTANLLRRRGESLGTLDVTVRKFYGPRGTSTLLSGLKPDVVLPSLTDDPKIGESSMPYTLDRDTVSSSDHKPTDDVTSEHIRELAGRSESRLNTSDEFARIRQAKKTWLDLQARTTMEFSTKSSESLSEVKRLSNLRDKLAGRTEIKDFGSNAYEAEVIHIVHDLVEVTRPSKEVK